MQEYRRFVAYFYEYIDGKKQKNVGFAKVELRNGVWRILFRLTAHVHPNPPIEVSGFVREGKQLLTFPMGTMRAGREMMEDWAYRAGEVLWMEKYGMEDLSGIWIQSGDERSFITVWDDEPFSPEQLVRELPEEAEEDSALDHLIEETESEENNYAVEREGEEFEVAASSVEMQGESGTAENTAEMQRKSRTEKDAAEMRSEPETSENAAEELGEEEISGYTADTREAFEASGSGAEEKNDIMQHSETNAEIGAEKNSPEAAVMKTETDYRREMERLWEELYRNRLQFQPFQDTEISHCIQIMPCDVTKLQRARWRTGRNSFLLHGYYNYRHLMLGIMTDGNYILGVPGVMNPQERYMAGMFGFPNFKYAEDEGKCQSYGYWYRILQHEA